MLIQYITVSLQVQVAVAVAVDKTAATFQRSGFEHEINEAHEPHP